MGVPADLLVTWFHYPRATPIRVPIRPTFDASLSLFPVSLVSYLSIFIWFVEDFVGGAMEHMKLYSI